MRGYHAAYPPEFYAPFEEDGSWPCIPVREVFEAAESDELARGLIIGIHNKRGVTSRSLTEGGAQERELADKYRGHAEACKIEWPRTAKALLAVADDYERHAVREDERRDERF